MRLADVQIKGIRGDKDFSAGIEDLDDVSGLGRNDGKLEVSIIVGLGGLEKFCGRIDKLDGGPGDRMELVSILYLTIDTRLRMDAYASQPEHPYADEKPYQISHLFIPDCA
jgi:hypothetical protein